MIMPINTNKEKTKKPKQFAVLDILDLEKSNAGNLLIDELANNRVNSLSWETLTTNSIQFNNYLINNSTFWETLYTISKLSLKGENYSLVIIFSKNQIIPCKIIEIDYLPCSDVIAHTTVLVKKIHWKNSDWNITWSFNNNSYKVKTNLELLNGIDQTDEEKEKYINESGYKYEYPILFPIYVMPVIPWYSLPNNEIFYQSAFDKAKTLSILNDMYIDQLVNVMTKRIDIDTNTNEMQSIIQNKTNEDLIFNPTTYIKTANLNDIGQTQALYQPNTNIIKDLRDTIDWFEQKMGNDKVSKEKETSKDKYSFKNINSKNINSLTINLTIWKQRIIKLIEAYDITTPKPIEVDLHLRESDKLISDSISTNN